MEMVEDGLSLPSGKRKQLVVSKTQKCAQILEHYEQEMEDIDKVYFKETVELVIAAK